MDLQGQSALFDLHPRQPRVWRLLRETSKAAYYQLGHQIPMDERTVFLGVAAYFYRHQVWPTSMELFEFLSALRAKHPRHPRYGRIKDVNNVRPRLTELNQRTPPLVVTGEKRRCTSERSKGHKMYVWRVPQLGEAAR